jgi:site-specific DNA-methyltransferase (adenine-specific)
MAEIAFISEDLGTISKVFECQPQGGGEGKIHPTQKPVALYRWIYQHYAKQGDKILDTHLGSGSSRIAAYDAGLDFVGYEIDETYFQLQEERFARHTAQMNLFID